MCAASDTPLMVAHGDRVPRRAEGLGHHADHRRSTRCRRRCWRRSIRPEAQDISRRRARSGPALVRRLRQLQRARPTTPRWSRRGAAEDLRGVRPAQGMGRQGRHRRHRQRMAQGACSSTTASRRPPSIIKGIVATLKPVVTDGHLALARATGAGEYWISLNNYVNLSINVKLAGGPIDVWALDPVALIFGQVGVNAQGAESERGAARREFMLSQEGQQFLAKFGRLPTRNDVTDNPPGTVAMLTAEEGHHGAADARGREGVAAAVPGAVQGRGDRGSACAARTEEATGVTRRTGSAMESQRPAACSARGACARVLRPRNLALDRLRARRRLAGVRAAGRAVLHRLHRGHRLRARRRPRFEISSRPIRAGTSSGCSAIR